ncbi:hypothetical protein AUQ38_07470 [Pseudomonas aeruginosa]|nr:hypothetical protein AUQ38_07470 [Pseudomonas aeruginosa]
MIRGSNDDGALSYRIDVLEQGDDDALKLSNISIIPPSTRKSIKLVEKKYTRSLLCEFKNSSQVSTRLP